MHVEVRKHLDTHVSQRRRWAHPRLSPTVDDNLWLSLLIKDGLLCFYVERKLRLWRLRQTGLVPVRLVEHAAEESAVLRTHHASFQESGAPIKRAQNAKPNSGLLPGVRVRNRWHHVEVGLRLDQPRRIGEPPALGQVDYHAFVCLQDHREPALASLRPKDVLMTEDEIQGPEPPGHPELFLGILGLLDETLHEAHDTLGLYLVDLFIQGCSPRRQRPARMLGRRTFSESEKCHQSLAALLMCLSSI